MQIAFTFKSVRYVIEAPSGRKDKEPIRQEEVASFKI